MVRGKRKYVMMLDEGSFYKKHMTDKQKLVKIQKYLKATRTALDRCRENDSEYDTSLGNGISACEASEMFREVEKELFKIILDKE